MIINRIQVLNYGCLRYVDVPMDRFHVLIGPNASGKSTLMDAIKFVSDVVRDGVTSACERRTSNFADLVWSRPSNPKQQRFEIVLEFVLPDEVRALLPPDRSYQFFRYTLAVGANRETNQIGIDEERGALLVGSPPRDRQLAFFPEPMAPVESMVQRSRRGMRTIFGKSSSGRSRYYPETVQKVGAQGWRAAFNLGAERSAMSILPDTVDEYPVTTRILAYLRDGIATLSLNSERMRRASPPGVGNAFLPDGSNVPWVVATFMEQDPGRYDDWVEHIQCALDGFESVRVVHRQDDGHKYLMVKYSNGLEVPSWKISDGTLRLMALTLLAYMPQKYGLFMIEEPENGIHPGVLQDVFDSLSSVYEAQVLLATHSPEFVAIANANHLLCFGKNTDGAVDVVPGRFHPHLRDWQSETDLGTFFASGILA